MKTSKHTIFILSHNSPNKCTTLSTLNKLGYDGDYFLIIDNEDKYVDEYTKLYNNHLIIFNKNYFKYNYDSGVKTVATPNCALSARNACEYIANELGLTHFVVMDDDIQDFRIRYLDDINRVVKSIAVGNFNAILDAYCNYTLDANLCCTSFGSQNFYMGGYRLLANGKVNQKRTVSNIMIRNTSIPMEWHMAMYEDFITSIQCNSIGKCVMTLPQVQFVAEPQYTQAKYTNSGESGNIDLYTSLDNFQRVFMPIVALPASIKTCKFKSNIIPRIIDYSIAYPKIISDKFKKE